MLLILCYLIISVLLIYYEYRKGFSSYDIFYCGFIIFVLFGWLSSYFLADRMYVLNGETEGLEAIVVDITQLFIVSTFFLLIQRKKRGYREFIINKQIPIKFINIGTILTVIFCLLIIVTIDIRNAPLLNIGKYSLEEMSINRSTLYSGSFISLLNVPRYIVYYMVIPVFFLLKGMKYKISNLALILFLFTSLLTLSKTMFIIIVFFYFIGKLIYTKKLYTMFYFIVISIFGYYLIVYFTYANTVERSFIDIFEKLYIRLIATPISLSAVYAEIFNYEQNFRSSFYYTFIFGGEFRNLPIDAMKYIAPESNGNAPTGMIGMSYPNVPKYLHWFYYLVFVFYVYFSSYLIKIISNPFIRIIFTVLFGVLSWFLFLTEPLVALNSYGLIYVTIFVLFFLFYKKQIVFKK